MIYIVIPVFNEEQNLLNLKKSLLSYPFDEEFCVVFSDDGSTDTTKEKIKEFFGSVKYIILGDGVNRGPGFAFNAGFDWVIQNSKDDRDIVLTIEADSTSDLEILPEMLMLNKMKYDLVLASVYIQGGGFDSTSLIRRFLSSVANLLYRFLFKVKVQTISSFYRVYSVSLLKRIKNNFPILIEEQGFICMLELLIKAIKSDAKIIEVPMVLKSTNRIGKSKMKIVKTSIEYFKFLLKLKFKK
jgi:dolichol-phosphate mannosyltransferase